MGFVARTIRQPLIRAYPGESAWQEWGILIQIEIKIETKPTKRNETFGKLTPGLGPTSVQVFQICREMCTVISRIACIARMTFHGISFGKGKEN